MKTPARPPLPTTRPHAPRPGLAFGGLLYLALLAAAPAEAAEADPIVLAPTLFDSTQDEIRSQLGPAGLIEQLSGRPVVVETHSRYEKIIDGFVEGRIDLAILGPLPYVQLHARADQALPLVRFREPDGRDHYRCTLIAFADGSRQLPDYAGMRLALTQPLSTCGYFGATTLLEQAQVDIESLRYSFLGPHDKVAIAVASGQFEIGALKDDVAKRFANLGVVPLASSGPLPGFTLIANAATLDAATRQRIRDGFLALQGNAPEQFANWPRHLRQGAVAAGHEDYREISADFARIAPRLQQVIEREKTTSQ